MLLDQAPGDEVSRLIVAVLNPEPLGDAVLQFVRIRERGVGIKTDELRKIVNPGYVVVVEVGFDRVLELFLRLRALKEPLKRWKPEIYAEFAVITINRLAAQHRRRVDRAGNQGITEVAGAERRRCGDIQPGAEVHGQRGTRRELRARDRCGRVDHAVTAMRRSGERV